MVVFGLFTFTFLLANCNLCSNRKPHVGERPTCRPADRPRRMRDGNKMPRVHEAEHKVVQKDRTAGYCESKKVTDISQGGVEMGSFDANRVRKCAENDNK